MTAADSKSSAPQCPGCHFRCLLNRYECARGKQFLDLHARGEELPQRRMPNPGMRNHMPLDGHVLHLLVLADAIGKHATQMPAHICVAQAALRHEGFATTHVVSERTQLFGSELEEALSQSVDADLITRDKDEDGREFIYITDTCRQQAQDWEAQTQAAQVEYLKGLNEVEKEQLVGLLSKILRSNRPDK